MQAKSKNTISIKQCRKSSENDHFDKFKEDFEDFIKFVTVKIDKVENLK
jgi:hypothetical protein